MSISASYSTASASPDYASDPQVQRLTAQIKDWTNCPTTPPAEKKQIVAKLQAQLDGTEAAIKQTESTKAETQKPPATQPGLGGNLDIQA